MTKTEEQGGAIYTHDSNQGEWKQQDNETHLNSIKMRQGSKVKPDKKTQETIKYQNITGNQKK